MADGCYAGGAVEWRAAESDDMFQSARYVGGFDADEDAFCVSAHLEDGRELWFQFSLEEAEQVANGAVLRLPARAADV